MYWLLKLYWQRRSCARPLCDKRATCLYGPLWLGGYKLCDTRQSTIGGLSFSHIELGFTDRKQARCIPRCTKFTSLALSGMRHLETKTRHYLHTWSWTTMLTVLFIDPLNSQDCRRLYWGLRTWVDWIFEKHWYDVITPPRVARNLAGWCRTTCRLWRCGRKIKRM